MITAIRVELATARPGFFCACTLAVAAFLPSMVGYFQSGSYALPFPVALYGLIMRISPMVLAFALLAAVPYVLPFTAQLKDRFLVYTRTRQSLRAVVVNRYLACVTVTFVTFFTVGLVPFLVALIPGTVYRPEVDGLRTAEDVAEAQAAYATFSELTRISSWLYVLVFSLWLATNAAVYASLALSSCLLLNNRLAGLTLPWVLTVLVSFACAFLGLERFSPDTILPFNVTQLPAWQPFVPFAVASLLAAAAVGWVVYRAPALSQLQ